MRGEQWQGRGKCAGGLIAAAVAAAAGRALVNRANAAAAAAAVHCCGSCRPLRDEGSIRRAHTRAHLHSVRAAQCPEGSRS